MLIIICIPKSFVYKGSVILLVALTVIYHRLLYVPASFFCFVCLFLWSQFHFLFCYVGAYASEYHLCQISFFFQMRTLFLFSLSRVFAAVVQFALPLFEV